MANLTDMSFAESRRGMRRVLLSALMLASSATASATASAQARSALDIGGAAVAGGEEIAYLRALGLLDTTYVPVMIQPLSRHAQQRLRAWAAERNHPWRGRFASESAEAAESDGGTRNRVEVLRPQLGLIYHSALPLSRNDGVVWAGRGVTATVQAGASLRWRAVDAQFAPIAFRAQNVSFPLAANGQVGSLAFNDSRFPFRIDHVQAFGDDAYTRLDPGESFVRLEAYGVSAGFATTTMSWGPGREYPLTMSPNAGGFAHVFLGTSRPWNIGIGTVNGRFISGRIEQSAYSSVVSGSLHRFTSGLVGSFTPRGLRGLELGATRVMQVRWPEEGPSVAQFLRPIQGVVSDEGSGFSNNQNDENQFASLFVRLAPPASGFEAYAEITRDDFTSSIRTLIAKPDDLALLLLGVSRARVRGNGTLDLFRVELTNGELSHHERGQRGLNPPYWSYGHHRTVQGLTSRGQILGSPVAAGGSGGTIAWDAYSPRGRSSLSFERQLRLDWLPALGATGGTRQAETLYGMRFERVRFAAGREWTLTLAPSRILNRNLVVGNDLWNLELGARWRGW